jgi:hypothetical protein
VGLIKADKKIVITIDGESVKHLSDICELARIYLQDHRDAPYAGGGMSVAERENIRGFLGDFFEATR